MALWDSIGTTYVEAATSALPLHRAVVFLAGFVGSVAIHHQTHLSVFESIANLSLASMTTLTTGPLERATLADLMIAAAVCVGSWIYSRASLRVIFALAARSTKLMDRLKVVQTSIPVDPVQTLEERQKTVELVDASLTDTRSRLRSMSASAELVGGLGIAALAASYWGNLLDGAIGITLCLTTFVLHIYTVQLFIAEYFGPAMFKARLQGRRPPSPTSMR